MRALAAPQAEEEGIEEILDSFDTLIDTGEDWVWAVPVDENPEEATEVFKEMEQATHAVRELAGEYTHRRRHSPPILMSPRWRRR